METNQGTTKTIPASGGTHTRKGVANVWQNKFAGNAERRLFQSTRRLTVPKLVSVYPRQESTKSFEKSESVRGVRESFFLSTRAQTPLLARSVVHTISVIRLVVALGKRMAGGRAGVGLTLPGTSEFGSKDGEMSSNIVWSWRKSSAVFLPQEKMSITLTGNAATIVSRTSSSGLNHNLSASVLMNHIAPHVHASSSRWVLVCSRLPKRLVCTN